MNCVTEMPLLSLADLLKNKPPLSNDYKYDMMIFIQNVYQNIQISCFLKGRIIQMGCKISNT